MATTERVEGEGRPLLEWVLARYPDTPRSRAKQWITAGRVLVGDTVMRRPQEQMVDPGKALRLQERDATGLQLGEGLQIHPRVMLCYLDNSLAVLSKGPGILAVPGKGDALSALGVVQDFLSGALRPRGVAVHLPPLLRKLELQPVHRLDQYTSGVFCVACNPGSREKLIEQVSNHTMDREYIGFCEGRAATTAGTWRDLLELSADEMRQRVVTGASGGARAGAVAEVEAVTHYEILKEYRWRDGQTVVSLVRFRLETGRKHQIRVQAANAGLPLVGDRIYNNGGKVPFDRQALHAERLALDHPVSGARQAWTAKWPEDLRRLEAQLVRR